jgi:CBS domain-containing protein
MRQNGYLARLSAMHPRGLASHQKELPPLVTVEAARRSASVDLMQRYGISRLPVVEEANGPAWSARSGATLLDRVYRDPAVVATAVSRWTRR